MAAGTRYEPWMREALALAARGEGRTAPNPLVGAIIIRGRELLGQGWHKKAGGPHAEVAAVRDAKRRGNAGRLKGATMIVTLEPCSTHGQTPPCTDLILKHGFARVVVGATDPNPSHAGRGLKLLEEQGVKVIGGVLAEACTDLNRDWNHFITTGKPWVVAKIAMSLDGRIAPPAKDSPWLTSAPARELAHELRLRAQAIVVGAKTVRADNPRLTVRLPKKRMAGKEQPWRVVLTRSGMIPRKAHLFTDEHKERTVIVKDVSIPDLLEAGKGRQVVNVLLEGGGEVLGSFFALGLVNEIAFFHAPCVLGQGAAGVELPYNHHVRERFHLRVLEHRQVGPDFFTRALVVPTPPA